MTWLKRIGFGLLIIYLFVCGLLYFFQDSLIFHPRPRTEAHRYGDFPEEWIELNDEERLHALRIPSTAGERRGVVLYLHGNVGDNGRSIRQTSGIRKSGYDLFLVDYRGFGKSSGTITGEQNMTEDLQAVYDRLKAEYGEKNILLAGYSLGSGPACYLAANNSPKGVVLVAPYTSLVDMKNEFFWMFPDFLMKYELNNFRHLGEATCPVRILHGTADELIPYAMGERLEAVAPDRIQLQALVGVGHRGAVLNPAFARAVGELVDN